MSDKTETLNDRQEINRNWAKPVKHVQVTAAPEYAMNLNVNGRSLVSPLQGYGQLWQKTYQVRLPGIELSPAEVMHIWRENFSRFQPPENRFIAPENGSITPGEVFLIEAKVPPFPGGPSILPVSTGVMVLYADETSFTVMNPEGHPLAGWNTFSVFQEDGCLVAQVLEQSRPNDPLYEVFNRFLGSSRQQDKIWITVLTNLAEYFDINEQVNLKIILLDPQVQWSEADNIWKNAAIRTVFYLIARPVVVLIHFIKNKLIRKEL
jgi:hypothetical protein